MKPDSHVRLFSLMAGRFLTEELGGEYNVSKMIMIIIINKEGIYETICEGAYPQFLAGLAAQARISHDPPPPTGDGDHSFEYYCPHPAGDISKIS
jgi:hypothetical protein